MALDRRFRSTPARSSPCHVGVRGVASRTVTVVNESDLKVQLDQMYDCGLMFHGFTDYMRDYKMVVYQSVDPRSGLTPRHLQFVFRFCTEADARSTVAPDVWRRSTDDQLLGTHHVTNDSAGYVWGVRCQILYPGPTIIENSHRAKMWEDQLGIPFHEVQIKGNAHLITLVFADLSVDVVSAGYAPYSVEEQGIAEEYADGSKRPLSPPEQ
jgi:hypothetical protein